MRTFIAVAIAVLITGCAAQGDVPDSQEKVYDSEVVLFVGPDSTALDSLREAMGAENFYTAADDMNWYRAQAYPLLDSLGIPYEFVDRQPLRFEVGDSTATYTWHEVDGPWFTVVYNGEHEPKVTYAVELSIDLADSLQQE